MSACPPAGSPRDEAGQAGGRLAAALRGLSAPALPLQRQLSLRFPTPIVIATDPTTTTIATGMRCPPGETRPTCGRARRRAGGSLEACTCSVFLNTTLSHPFSNQLLCSNPAFNLQVGTMWGVFSHEEAEKFKPEPGTHPHYKHHGGDAAEERPKDVTAALAAGMKGAAQENLRLE